MNASRLVEERGFAIFAEVFSKLEMHQLIQSVEQSMLKRSKAGVRHALRHPAIETLARDPRLLLIAAEILGADAQPFRATLFDKSPRSNWLVVWHQDTALPLRDRCEVEGWGPWSVKDGVYYAHAPASTLRQVLALRIHIDDSDANNGPLRVLPATHNEGVLTDDAIRDLAKQTTPVDCLVPQGGVLAMRPLIIHASSKSQLEKCRRVLHIEYSASLTMGEGLQLAIV